MINVTKTFLPPIKEYEMQLERIWKNQWLTNRGELVLELEGKLKDYLKVNNVILVNNGTIPLQIAVKLLGNGGEIITTPFSYVATTSSIVWEHCKPVFVDINSEYLTIDENKIESAITAKTTAILVTHVFGNPCNVDAIEEIASKYKLKVIYDAAHCFGVTYRGRSIFDYGDISTCSFHATKLFHTGEGGAIFCNDPDLNFRCFYSHNFGHKNQMEFHGLGINGKISELQAAMGLAVLPHMPEVLAARKTVVDFYNANLSSARIRRLKIREHTRWNYSYYPVVFESEEALLKTYNCLIEHGIAPRRYFYPSLNTLSYVDECRMPISESIASRVLCLPLYDGLATNELDKITYLINDTLTQIYE